MNLNFNVYHKYDRVIKHTFNSLPENISVWFEINQLSKMCLVMIAKQNSLLCIHVYLTTALQTKICASIGWFNAYINCLC